MPNMIFCRKGAAEVLPRRALMVLGGLGVLSACAVPPMTRQGNTLPMRVPGAPTPPTTAQSLDAAVRDMTVALFDRARIDPPGPSDRYDLVIDPLIDRATGSQTAATRGMEQRMAAIVRERYPDFELRPFSSASLARKPIILLGAITPVAGEGIIPPSREPRPGVYRIWAVLGDLRSGQVVSHETAWVQAGAVDAAPTGFFRDSPAWAAETITTAYLQTCAGNPGDPIDPRYLEALQAQALIADGIRAYEEGEPQQALSFYQAALREPDGEQLKARNGIYLSNRALGRAEAAEQAFGDVVDHGLDRGLLAVKFLFRPGTTSFWPNPEISGDYPMWLRQIARRSAPRDICLGITGHASPTGSPAWNQRLSLGRAQSVRQALMAEEASLALRTDAEGAGAAAPLVGTGTDDLTDALDRRVEFAVEACPLPRTASLR
ncbi:OmpA family protein [Pseudoroseomonas oryzae]|uniref:OmpA family protein n=2 Tax=Teichococcus oryzae TaxID=1608942 RepID=A0A5B2TM73_9PROT|nr:OmpA family protein [Pseudoroseomonas oryzae]